MVPGAGSVFGKRIARRKNTKGMKLGDEHDLESRIRFSCIQVVSRRQRSNPTSMFKLAWYFMLVLKQMGCANAFTPRYYIHLCLFSLSCFQYTPTDRTEIHAYR